MPGKKPFLRLLTEAGPMTVLAVVLALLVAITAPASAQFFFFGGPQRQPQGQPQPQQRGWFGGDFFTPFQQQAPKRVENYSKAPPPEKREVEADHNVLVLGDAMADWLAYGLEDAYGEQPDMGVLRRHKTVSGLIRYQPKGDPVDWAAAAKTILPAEKADVIVVMLGLNDRAPIREPVVEKPARQETRRKGPARQT
jgi:uncharacterized protein